MVVALSNSWPFSDGCLPIFFYVDPTPGEVSALEAHSHVAHQRIKSRPRPGLWTAPVGHEGCQGGITLCKTTVRSALP